LLSSFVLAGSKNVHLMARTRADIDFYADGRFQVARTVAKTVFDTLESLGEEKKRAALEYLSSTHRTACFELIDPNDLHVEMIDLKKPELRFIGN